jgi:hypothetical protein
MTSNNILQSIRDISDAPLRNTSEFWSKARIMGRDPTDVNHSQIENGKEFGVNFFSELWLWPGVQVNHVLANDFMHCEVQGESQKHFLKVCMQSIASYIF